MGHQRQKLFQTSLDMGSKTEGDVEVGVNFTATAAAAMIEFIIEHSGGLPDSDFGHDDPQPQKSFQWMKQRIRSLNLVVNQIVFMFGVRGESVATADWFVIITGEVGAFGEFIRGVA